MVFPIPNLPLLVYQVTKRLNPPKRNTVVLTSRLQQEVLSLVGVMGFIFSAWVTLVSLSAKYRPACFHWPCVCGSSSWVWFGPSLSGTPFSDRHPPCYFLLALCLLQQFLGLLRLWPWLSLAWYQFFKSMAAHAFFGLTVVASLVCPSLSLGISGGSGGLRLRPRLRPRKRLILGSRLGRR